MVSVGTCVVGQKNLETAKRQKRDEFYTQLRDIENELRHYREHFRGKVIFCNCDDPYESNFFKYFSINFNFLGLKKLITTSYTNSPIAGDQLPLLDIEGLKPDGAQPFVVEITEVPDANNDGAIDLGDVAYLLKSDKNSATPLTENGDFRSPECIEYMMQADIVCTNPPFSLFREYVAQLMEYDRQFLIIGHQNAITYKEIFDLIRENRVWLGHGFKGGATHFINRYYEDYAVSGNHKEGMIRVSGVHWFTNLDTTKRHEELTLYKKYTPEQYPKYANYEAIEVSKVVDIPLDYEGEMGVPITFLDKYNPEQFEIIGSSRTHGKPMAEIAERGTFMQGGPRFYLAIPSGPYRFTRLYDRLLIKHRNN